MASLSESLSEHHRRCDRLFALAHEAAAAEDWQDYVRQLAAVSESLGRHIDFEEGELFPSFEQTTGLRSGPTEVMRAEHARMRALLAVLVAAAPHLDPHGCRRELGCLRAMLEQHNAKEEAALYPACERVLGTRLELLASAQALNGPARQDVPRVLDVRGLAPPEPFVRIMDCLARPPAAPLRVLIHHEPLPLYEVLRAQGFRYRARSIEGGGFEILIEPAAH